MLNRCVIIGRLCADPEFRQTPAGVPVCRIRVAVNRPKAKDGSQEADFIPVTAWRQTAEFVSRHFVKGQMIVVEGKLRNNDYTDNNGVKHYSMEVVADQVDFGGDKQQTAAPAQEYAPQYGAAPAQTPPQPYHPPQYPQYQSTGYPAPPQPYQPPQSAGYAPPPHFDTVPDYQQNYPKK